MNDLYQAVTAAVILNRQLTHALIALRDGPQNMLMHDRWHFPGGKVEPGEAPEHCVVREMEEELGVGVSVQEALEPIERLIYTLTPPPVVTLTGRPARLHPFVCTLERGEPRCLPGQGNAALWWVTLDTFGKLRNEQVYLPEVTLRLALAGFVTAQALQKDIKSV